MSARPLFATSTRVVLTFVWLGLAGYMCFYYAALGKALGGAQYMAHMGQSGAAAAILLLAFGCLLMAGVLLFFTPLARALAIAMTWAGGVFVIAQWLPLPLLSLISTYVRPLGFKGEYMLFALPIFALLTLAAARSKSSTEQITTGEP
jgi:hypothetical protein